MLTRWFPDFRSINNSSAARISFRGGGGLGDGPILGEGP